MKACGTMQRISCAGMGDCMNERALPLGFGMALAQNEPAMQRFEAMTEAEKAALLQQVSNVSSKTEMEQLVANLGQSGMRE